MGTLEIQSVEMSYASSSNVRVQKWWNGLGFQNLPLSKFVKMIKEFTAT